jgi:hypothetical protein
MVERLSRWKDEGAITSAQFERLGGDRSKDRFSVSLELNALLYLGVLSIAAGLLWTVRTHFTDLGRHRGRARAVCDRRPLLLVLLFTCAAVLARPG